jgi:hypothetical protein
VFEKKKRLIRLDREKLSVLTVVFYIDWYNKSLETERKQCVKQESVVSQSFKSILLYIINIRNVSYTIDYKYL